jgi:amino acid adenylation domain-containing protein
MNDTINPREKSSGPSVKREAPMNHLLYWKKQLAGAPKMLELPTDRPRSTEEVFRRATHRFALPSSLRTSLRELSQREGTTLFMNLITAFVILLWRYTGQDDLLVGTPLTYETLSECELSGGVILNTLVLRAKLAGELTFRELLKQIQQTVSDARLHRHLPFQRLVQELGNPAASSRQPIFQVMFHLAAGGDKRRTPDRSPPSAAVQSQCDLTLSMVEQREQLSGKFDYNRNLFLAPTLERMAGHFQVLLQEIVNQPDRAIGELPLLTGTEREQMLVEWNATDVDYPLTHCFHRLFEAQVARTPDAVAVVQENDQLSYRQLNERANQLAHYLARQGIGPDRLVGLAMERSEEMVVGMLGIFKAGGAYVPLDPTYPSERLAFMVDDAKMPVLLTQPHLVNRIPAGQAKVVCLSSDWQMFAEESKENLSSKVTAENLAYVMYTSGSTGKPKGVMIPQKGLVNYLSWATEAYKVASGRGAPVHSSIGFDLTITSLFAPLLVGQRVVLLPEDRSIQALTDLVRNEKHFSLIKITPAHLEVLSQQLKPEQAAGCAGAFVIGGEALWGESLDFWCTHAPATRLINEYGPTETVVGCCVYEVPGGSCPSGAVPIGRPIANTQLYILDRHRQPVPVGVTGELYIGGAGVGRGYLNSPALSAEKFVVDPFSSDPQARLYKTGDLARYRADGIIEYLGRIDHQVKIRGFRIELGEIEAALMAHPAIEQAVVVVREDNPGDKRLLAYLVSTSGEPLESKFLRAFLQQLLPDYMLPAAFVFMRELPLTLNGKVDRAALPAPEYQRESATDVDVVPPRDELERQLVEIWEKVLAVRPIGIDDNFFDLGGHSLLVVRLVAQMEKKLNVNLPVSALLQAPSIEQLALIVRQKKDSANGKSLLYFSQTSSAKPALFSYGGSVQLARYLGADQPFYLLQSHGVDGRRAPETVEEMAAESLAEIRSIQPKGPYFLAGYSFGGLVIFEVAQRLRQQGETIALLTLIDPSLPNVRLFDATNADEAPPPCGLFSEILYHCRNLARLGLRQKLDYVGTRVEGRVRMLRQGVKRMACELCLDMGYCIPPFLRLFYFMQISNTAIDRYEPRAYPTPFIVLRRAENGTGEEWRHLASDKVEIHEIDAEHLEIIQEPYVQILADKLRSFLDSAA